MSYASRAPFSSSSSCRFSHNLSSAMWL
jgi:hypothetical protein